MLLLTCFLSVQKNLRFVSQEVSGNQNRNNNGGGGIHVSTTEDLQELENR